LVWAPAKSGKDARQLSRNRRAGKRRGVANLNKSGDQKKKVQKYVVRSPIRRRKEETTATIGEKRKSKRKRYLFARRSR